jgi:hypothetical protein
MKTLHTIDHKKDETFDVNFFEDAKCTVPFDFKGKEHLYIELKYGDISPITAMADKVLENASVYTPYIPNCHKPYPNRITTFDAITPDLSKYIPEDNAVLFLSEEDKERFYVKEFSEKVLHRTPLVSPYLINRGEFPRNIVYGHFNDNNSSYTLNGEQKGVHPIYRKITIFLTHGTQSELQKAKEVLKELKEKYGVEEVNLFALHCFVHKEHSQNGNPYTNYKPQNGLFKYKRTSATMSSCEYCDTWDIKYECCYNFNKIITTTSTGILKPEDSSERLQVIDCKEFFEEHLNQKS